MYDEAGHLLGEYDTNAQVLQETIYIGDTPVAIVTPEGPAIVVDNTTAGETTAVGTWTASTSVAGYLGANYVYHTASTGTDSFTWSLGIPTTGSYHVYARWTTSSNRSTAATFTVGSNAAVHENQQNNNGVWILLGTYSLSSGTTNIKLTTDNTGDVIADAVKAVLATNDGSSTYYIYPDQVDAPRIVTRPVDNQMVWRWDQTDPFGAAAPNQNPAGLGSFAYNPRFPGQLYDQENNLYYNYFRYYDPSLGRYVESDPIGLRGGLPTYPYVGNSPLDTQDPLGRKPLLPNHFPNLDGPDPDPPFPKRNDNEPLCKAHCTEVENENIMKCTYGCDMPNIFAIRICQERWHHWLTACDVHCAQPDNAPPPPSPPPEFHF
jgi:RHS repeat-associated protein